MSTHQASRSVREGGLEGHQGGAGREREQSIDESKRGEVTLRVWLVGGAKRAGHSSWRYERHDTKQRARTHTRWYTRTHTHTFILADKLKKGCCAQGGRERARARERRNHATYDKQVSLAHKGVCVCVSIQQARLSTNGPENVAPPLVQQPPRQQHPLQLNPKAARSPRT